MKPLLLACLLALLPQAGDAKTSRSKVAITAFKATHPCPATGLKRGPCHGYQVDHIKPLCANGPDTPDNMQWLTLDDHRIKTRTDVKVCRQINPCNFNKRHCKLN